MGNMEAACQCAMCPTAQCKVLLVAAVNLSAPHGSPGAAGVVCNAMPSNHQRSAAAQTATQRGREACAYSVYQFSTPTACTLTGGASILR